MRNQRLNALAGMLGMGFGLLWHPCAIAAPAPVIRFLINDIHRELPEDLLVRLPATLPNSSAELYPYLSSNPQGLTILFGITPDCATSEAPNRCTVGGLGAFPQDFEGWRSASDRLIPINITINIEGHTFTRGQGQSTNRFITWEQEGVRYVIGALEALVSQDELLIMARSTVTESPITPVSPEE
jgi:hypothetical protein